MTPETTSQILMRTLRQVDAKKALVRSDEFKNLLLGNYGYNIVASAYLPDGFTADTAKSVQDATSQRKSDEISSWYALKRKQYQKFLDYADAYVSQDVDSEDPETTRTTKTNDTPTDIGDYSSDKYTSNVVRTTSVQKRSHVQRYIEARETLINDIYPKLIKEFYDTFVIEQQEGLY